MPACRVPAYARPGDAGADLYAVRDVVLEPGERALVGTGVAIALPSGYAGFVHPRSGLAARAACPSSTRPARSTLATGARSSSAWSTSTRAPRCASAAATGSPSWWCSASSTPGSSRSTGLPASERGAGGYGSTGGHPRTTRRPASGPQPRRAVAAPDQSVEARPLSACGSRRTVRTTATRSARRSPPRPGRSTSARSGCRCPRGHGRRWSRRRRGAIQAVHVTVPEGRLSVSALAAPRTGGLWADLAVEIDASLREGGARVRSFTGEWGRELHATTEGATSVFVGVDGPRWMLYGVATGPTRDAVNLDARLRRMLRGTIVVRGRAPYPVRTVLPLVTPPGLGGEEQPTTSAPPDDDPAHGGRERRGTDDRDPDDQHDERLDERHAVERCGDGRQRAERDGRRRRGGPRGGCDRHDGRRPGRDRWRDERRLRERQRHRVGWRGEGHRPVADRCPGRERHRAERARRRAERRRAERRRAERRRWERRGLRPSPAYQRRRLDRWAPRHRPVTPRCRRERCVPDRCPAQWRGSGRHDERGGPGRCAEWCVPRGFRSERHNVAGRAARRHDADQRLPGSPRRVRRAVARGLDERRLPDRRIRRHHSVRRVGERRIRGRCAPIPATGGWAGPQRAG